MSRVNNGEIRRLVNEERGKITDQELFSSRAMRRHFENIAAAQTRRYSYRHRIGVRLFWDPHNKRAAYTSDRQISINGGCNIVTALPKREMRYRAVYGMFSHELGHILHTDFLSFQSYALKVEAGQWYPRRPKVGTALKANEDEVLAYCQESEVHMKLFLGLTYHLENILEDGYVNDRMYQQYSGALGENLRFLYKVFWDSAPTLTQLIEKETDPRLKWQTITQLIVSYCVCGDIHYGETSMDDERVQVLFSLVKTLDKALLAKQTKERFHGVNTIVLMCWPYIKEYLAFCEEQMNQASESPEQAMERMQSAFTGTSATGSGSSSPASGSASTGDDAGEDDASRSLASKRRSAASRMKAPATPQTTVASGQEPSEEQGAGQPESQPSTPCAEAPKGQPQTEDAEPGQEPQEESDSATEQQDPPEETDENTPQPGTGEQEQAEDTGASCNPDAGCQQEDSDCQSLTMQGIPSRTQEVKEGEGGRIPYHESDGISAHGTGELIWDGEYQGSGYKSAADDIERMLTSMAEVKVEEQRRDTLNELVQNVPYNGVHDKVDKVVHRIADVDSSLVEMYSQVAPPLISISKRLQKSVVRQLQNRRKGGKQTGLYIGRRLDVHALPRQDGRVFYKASLPNEKAAMAVGLLLDESGSMSYGDRATYARSAAIILYDFCRALHIPVMVYGHSTYYGVDLYSYAEFESVDQNDKYRLMDISARGANRDGCALQYMAEQLVKRPEEVKLLILVSDGQPCDDGYEGSAAEEDLRWIKATYQKRGIHIIAAAIGSDKKQIERIYGDSFLDITNLEELPVTLTQMVKRFIRI